METTNNGNHTFKLPNSLNALTAMHCGSALFTEMPKFKKSCKFFGPFTLLLVKSVAAMLKYDNLPQSSPILLHKLATALF